MSKVIHIGGRRPVSVEPTANPDAERKADMAGAKWQLKLLMERMKSVHGDNEAKRAILDVAGHVWPDSWGSALATCSPRCLLRQSLRQ